jgi:similar to spore coat protein
MANMIRNLAGMGNMTEQVIATDFLMGSKAAIKNYAAALSEAATPEVKDTLRRQLGVAIDTHGKITNYMIDKGYYNAYDPQAQSQTDMQASSKVMDLM